MAIATYRGERNVGEITDNLYTKLTPLQREKATAALVKANPQLKNIRKLPRGTVLRVPDLPELRAKTNRDLESPDEQIVKNLAASLSSLGKQLDGQFSSEQKSVKSQVNLIKSARFKRDISKSELTKSLAADAAKALDQRSKTIAQRKKATDTAIKQAIKDLKEGFL